MSSSATPSHTHTLTHTERETDPDRRRSSDCSRRINSGLCAGRPRESCRSGSRWRGGLPVLPSTLPRHSHPGSADAEKGWPLSGDRADVAMTATADHCVDPRCERRRPSARPRRGSEGYLLKGAEPEQVCDTIREVFAGKSSVPYDLAAKLGAGEPSDAGHPSKRGARWPSGVEKA
jgi:hypothetical protein